MIKVQVPATSANLGPGFDTLGLALNLYNTFTFQEIPEGLEITGCEAKFANENNLVYTSMLKTFNRIGYSINGMKVDIKTDIPVSRGLGSSATCILGGVIGANKIAGSPLTKDEILELATEIEGHPDNIAPALFGGLVVSVMEREKIFYNQINVSKGIKFVALIPDFTLSTRDARHVLPSSVSYGDAIYNIGKVSLLLSALSNGRHDLVKIGIKDKLHQPYRGKLIPRFEEILNKCDEMGSLGVFLSGAGPTIMALIDDQDTSFTEEIQEYLKSIDYNWDVKELELNLSGAITV